MRGQGGAEVPDTPHDHGVFAELVGLPLAKPMFSRYFRLSNELGLTTEQLDGLRGTLAEFHSEMTSRHADIIETKNELRQVIVDVSDARSDDWTAVHALVDRLYDTARALDHAYYDHMKRGYGVLTPEQSSQLMDTYEREELDRMPAFRAPIRSQRRAG